MTVKEIYSEPTWEGYNTKRKRKGWLAPSVKNKVDVQINMIRRYMKVCPITSIVVECAKFDTHLLAAIEKGTDKPEGKDYQRGPTYESETLREAVFARDGYTCIVCGSTGYPKGGKPAAVLRMHHLGFRTGDHSNRIDNLATVCVKCHTPANHKPGGKLYDLKPKLKQLNGASFMNTVKWYIYGQLAKEFPGIVHITYGAKTKRSRKDLKIEKSHANDAYCMGDLHPQDRADTKYYQKVRRHNRILSKFYDAKYIDSRDGSTKKGAELPSGRTNRNHKRDTENLRKYRKTKVSKGRTVIRIGGGAFQPGDIVCYKGRNYCVAGMKNGNKAVQLKSVERTVNPSVNSVKLLRHSDGWRRTEYNT